MQSLADQIEHELLLVRGARERRNIAEECEHRNLLDDLLARVPHDTRF